MEASKPTATLLLTCLHLISAGLALGRVFPMAALLEGLGEGLFISAIRIRTRQRGQLATGRNSDLRDGIRASRAIKVIVAVLVTLHCYISCQLFVLRWAVPILFAESWSLE